MSAADADAILDAHAQLELLGGSGVSLHHHSDILMRGVGMAREVGGLLSETRDSASPCGMTNEPRAERAVRESTVSNVTKVSQMDHHVLVPIIVIKEVIYR